MTDAELFAERIYFTPEERKAFLRGVEWAKPKSIGVENWDRMQYYQKKRYIYKMFVE